MSLPLWLTSLTYSFFGNVNILPVSFFIPFFRLTDCPDDSVPSPLILIAFYSFHSILFPSSHSVHCLYLPLSLAPNSSPFFLAPSLPPSEKCYLKLVFLPPSVLEHFPGISIISNFYFWSFFDCASLLLIPVPPFRISFLRPAQVWTLLITHCPLFWSFSMFGSQVLNWHNQILFFKLSSRVGSYLLVRSR